jgi:ParB/RepB/Spo0J family partition protein
MANESVKQVPIKEIHANAKWNSRHGDWTKDFDVDTETPEFQALVEAIKTNPGGIHTALIIRPNPDAKTPPWSLVSGFRRLGAAKVLGLETVPCIIREYDEVEARITNIAENTVRADLKGADLAWACGELAKMRLNDERIAAVVGRSVSYVSKLTSIMTNVRSAILKNWREQVIQEVTVQEMYDLAQLPKDLQDAEWTKIVGAHSSASKAGKGKGKWIKTLKSKAYNIGFILGTLRRTSLINKMSDDFKKLCDATVPYPKKAIARHKDACASSFEEGFNDGMVEPVIEETEDEVTNVID